MKRILYAMLAAVMLAACSPKGDGQGAQVCEREYTVKCPADTSTVLNVTIRLDVGEDLTVPCGQFICNRVAKWTTQQLDNTLSMLDEGYSQPCEVRGMPYAPGTPCSAIADYYGNMICQAVGGALKECACSQLPCGPITLYLKIQKVWADETRCTYMIHQEWDYSGSCGATYETIYRTVESATGRELSLYDYITQEKYADLEEDVFSALKEAKRERDAMTEELEEQNAFAFFMENMVELEDVASQRGDSLVFMFPPYRVGCGAEGDYEIVLPIPSAAE